MTLRARLTLIYGGLFLIAGVALLGTTYALFDWQLSNMPQTLVTRGEPLAATRQMFVFTGDGELLTGAPAERWMREQQSILHDAATTSLLTQGGIALGVVGALAAGFGWLVAGRVLVPLRRVTDTARRIAAAPAAASGLRERIALRGPDDEVKDLANAFNTMVERLDRSFDGQRRFVANASHELRTPLTLGRSLVELAMHRKSASADLTQLGEHLLRINSRHEQLITGLLLLARSDNELTERLPVDLADLVTHVVAQTAPEAAQAGVTVQDHTEEAVTTGDALLLERLVHNLVENGIRHNTGPGGQVEIATRTHDDGHIEVRVRNTGPVVPHHEIPALFEPFRRLPTVHPPKGAGLGLSIVRSITHAHGGEATARPQDEGGLVVTIRLPGVTRCAVPPRSSCGPPTWPG